MLLSVLSNIAEPVTPVVLLIVKFYVNTRSGSCLHKNYQFNFRLGEKNIFLIFNIQYIRYTILKIYIEHMLR